MTRGASGRTRGTGMLLFVLAVLALASGRARAQSFDCAKAGTAVERAICGDERLKRLDADLASNYRSAAGRLVPDGAHAFVASQRSWVTGRDRRCATGDRDCLVAEYQSRNDALLALVARTSADNPVIDLADAASLHGDWIVAADTVEPAGEARSIPTAEHLPPAGAHLTATTGSLCIRAPEDAKACFPFGLAVLGATARGKRHDPAIMPDALALLAYFNGRADFDLVVASAHELIAHFRACGPGATACRWQQQRWTAASPDARVETYRLFGSTAP